MKKILLLLITCSSISLMAMENIAIALPKQQDQEQKYEHLNPSDIETFSTQPFYELIEDAHAKGASYGLARVQTHDDTAKTEANKNPIHYFDQYRLHEYFQGNPPADFKPCNEYKNPVNRFPIENIDYFAINVAAKTAIYTHSYAAILKGQTERCQRELWRQQNPTVIVHSSDSAPTIARTMGNSERTGLIVNTENSERTGLIVNAAAAPEHNSDFCNCCDLTGCCDCANTCCDSICHNQCCTHIGNGFICCCTHTASAIDVCCTHTASAIVCFFDNALPFAGYGVVDTLCLPVACATRPCRGINDDRNNCFCYFTRHLLTKHHITTCCGVNITPTDL
jgi:hypothetical protein